MEINIGSIRLKCSLFILIDADNFNNNIKGASIFSDSILPGIIPRNFFDEESI